MWLTSRVLSTRWWASVVRWDRVKTEAIVENVALNIHSSAAEEFTCVELRTHLERRAAGLPLE